MLYEVCTYTHTYTHIIVHYSILQYTEGALQYTEGALQYTEGALQYTEGALQYTEAALQYTEGALQYTEGALQYTEGALLSNSKRHLLGTSDGLFPFVLYHLCSKVSVVSVNEQLQCGTQRRRSYWEKREGRGGGEGGREGGKERGRRKEGREEGKKKSVSGLWCPGCCKGQRGII